MIEVRIHGRGGQGNVVAAYLLASAAIRNGMHAQAFPAFGAERRGAPVAAFVRIDKVKIRRRCEVLAPDFLIIQDAALMHIPGITAGLKSSGCILLNSATDTSGFHADAKLLALPATTLAQQYLGRPVPNTALLTAFLTLTEMIPVDFLIQSLSDRFKGEILDKNITLIDAVFGMVNEQFDKTGWRQDDV